LDVIFCRNVFIYFDRPTQQQILLRFLDCLRPAGHIFLGHSETINGLSLPLVQVAPTIYRRV
jgi:chemotaxis protein methyltransferase CheR